MRKAELRVRMDERIYNALKKVAQKEGRTVSELVREAVADLLKKRETENETLEIAQ